MRKGFEKLSRRQVLARGVSVVGAASGVLGAGHVVAQAAPAAAPARFKVGLMLPYSGTYAKLGEAIENGMRMAVAEKGGRLAGREVEWIKLDDESEPKKADANARRLVAQDKVDVIVGTVHSGVQMAIQKVVAESGTLSIIPNAGVHAVTRNACLPNVFRTSFTMGQPTVALGQAMIERKARRAVWVTWDYPAGADSLEGFREGYVKAGGSIVKELKVPFPSTDFSAVLAEIAQLKPDAVACFFAGGGAVKFMQDYEKAGLRQGLEAVQGDTPCRATTAACCCAKAWRRYRATRASASSSTVPWRRPSSTARVAGGAWARRTTRCRTSTCAPWPTARTASSAWPPRRWRIRVPAASWPDRPAVCF